MALAGIGQGFPLRTAMALVVLAAVVTAFEPQQQTSPTTPQAPARPPQFRSGVDLVQVDVSVLDRKRQPVRGLRQSEFTVLENGKEQPIYAFQPVDMPDELPPPTPWMREVLPDVRRNDEAIEHRLIVLVMDDASAIFFPSFTASAKEIGHRVINQMGTNDLAAVLYTLDNRKSQNFTEDRGSLHAAVERFAPGFRTVGVRSGDAAGVAAMALAESNAFTAAVETLAKASEYLAAVPHRRKALIYVSSGVPVDMESAATPVLIGSGVGGTEVGAMMGRLKDRMNNIFRQAQLANVNIYPVDPAGLGGVEQYIAAQAASGVMIFPYENPRNYMDFLQVLAANTGGHAFVNTNEFETGVAQIFRENSSYYILGYHTPDPTADGKFRRIEVRVSRPDLEVRARSGYYAPKAEDLQRRATRPPSPVAEAISGLLPKRDLPMQLAVASFAVPSKREAGVALVTAVRQRVDTGMMKVVEKVELSVYAYNNDGKLVTSQGFKADVTMRPGVTGEVAYELLSRLDLRPGRYQLRFGANVPRLEAAGSVYYDIDVPDYSEAPLSLSSMVLSATPSVMSAPKDRLKTLIPVVPTARRDFVANSKVTAFIQVYQGGREKKEYVDLDVNILDSKGENVFHSLHEIAPDRFATRGADYQLELPMERLAPGAYLLSIEASTRSDTARRDVRFVVVR